jgi:hypothetical protein
MSCGGFGDWGFGFLRDQHVPLNLIFGAFAGVALLSLIIVLLIRPSANESIHTTSFTPNNSRK